MKLYYVPMTRSMRPRWLLEELEVPYELVRLDPSKQETKTPAYLALNPNGTVPTLVDGDAVLFESAAMMIYLADRYPDKALAPPVTALADRADFLKWIVFSIAELEPWIALYFQHSARLPEAQRVPAILEHARERANARLAILARAVTGREFLVGQTFTAADVLVASILSWAKLMGLVEDAELLAYTRRHMARPAAKRARAD